MTKSKKETPIIMKPELAFYAHVGQKTNTLRIITKPRWAEMTDAMFYAALSLAKRSGDPPKWTPYGLDGDHLWVKETHFAWGRWVSGDDGKRTFQHIGREEKCRFTLPSQLIKSQEENYEKRTMEIV